MKASSLRTLAVSRARISSVAPSWTAATIQPIVKALPFPETMESIACGRQPSLNFSGLGGGVRLAQATPPEQRQTNNGREEDTMNLDA